VLVRARYSTRNPGPGHRLAPSRWPGDTSRAGGQVWFGCGKLAADLSLPKLRVRWDDASVPT
jgi:hypothetical protein